MNHLTKRPRNYTIHRAGNEDELGPVTVTAHEIHKAYWLTPKRSLEIRNHSPTFEFGYHGSGPAQLALAILLDFTDDKQIAEAFYQDFKREFIAPLDHPGGTIIGNEIQKWIDKQQEAWERALEQRKADLHRHE
jgi:hypothetical protein